jgi:hypothetical protein
MPTVPPTFSKFDGADYEPDDEWKGQLRKRIEEGLLSMVTDAKENLAAELRKASDSPETRMRLEADYKQAMQTIKNLASEEYQLELDRERNQRRWTAGVPMSAAWSQYFHNEQQNIMNSIKQSSNQTNNFVRTTSESPIEERRSAIPKPSDEPPALARPPNPSVRFIYSEPQRPTTYPDPVPWRSPYPNPSHDRSNNRSLPPDDWEDQRPQDGAQPGPSRRASYIRPRDNPDTGSSENGLSWIIALWKCISC